MKNQPNKFPTTALGAFCSKHEISLAMLAKMCDYASRSTMHRLVHNDLAPDYRKKLIKLLCKNLPTFLMTQGLSRAEIDQELIPILNGDYQPMISQRIELTPDECRWFGFKDREGRPVDPFTNPPRSRDEVFISPPLQAVIDRVIDAIRYQGIVQVTGDIGSGKSTLRALIQDHISENQNLAVVWPEFFDMKMVSPMQIAQQILDHFQVHCPGSSVRRGKAVKDLLSGLYSDGTRVAIGIDECHRLNDAALSSLKNFLEMNSGGFQRYLGVFMLGQPSFEARLRDSRFRELVERIVPLRMPDFGQSAGEYLAFRLHLVGVKATELFDKDAIEMITGQATTPLQLGNIANEALRTSKRDFNNKTVVGAAIKTKMFFENRKDVQAFRKRA
jgi:type II secretory pathway predicted ATPase ExeA